MNYELDTKKLGGLTQNDDIATALSIEDKFKAISEICKGKTLNKYTTEYYDVLDLLGKLIVAFGGKYENINPEITEDEKTLLFSEIVGAASDETKSEISRKVSQLQSKAEENGETFSENSDDVAAILLEEIAKSKDISIESILGEGHTEIRTEDEEFAVLNVLANS